MKKLLITLSLLFVSTSVGSIANASDNHLHTIILEKNNSSYNVILGSDKVTKVTKKTPSNNELIIDVKGIEASENVNALYKGSSNIDGLVVENLGQNKLRIHLNAENAKHSTVIIEPINGQTVVVGDSMPIDKMLWTLFVFGIFCVAFIISKNIHEEESTTSIKRNLKERELQLYRKYREQMFVEPSINSKHDLRMKKMIKKIDRKIDDRLSSTIK